MGAVVAWIVAGTWRACADAVRERVTGDAEVVLLHVPGPPPGADPPEPGPDGDGTHRI